MSNKFNNNFGFEALEEMNMEAFMNSLSNETNTLNENFDASGWDHTNKKFRNHSEDGPNHLVINLPVDSERDFKDCHSLIERRNKINKGDVECITLVISPTYDKDKHASKNLYRIKVKLMIENNETDYVDILLKNNGIDIEEGHHKYFLRSFDKRTRHLILGFCLTKGYILQSASSNAGYNKGMFRDNSIREIENAAYYYKDSDAPKRINYGLNK